MTDHQPCPGDLDGSLDGRTDDDRPLSQAAAEAWIPRTCFKHGPPGQIGIELEFLHRRTPGPEPGDPRRVARQALLAAPVAGTVSIEPGGQVELSTPPAPGLLPALSGADLDLATLCAVAARHGTVLTGPAMHPGALGPRILDEPRYRAMERYFDRWGPAGRRMMRATVSVQVNVEAEVRTPPPAPNGTPGPAPNRTSGPAPNGTPGPAPTTPATHAGTPSAELRWAVLHAVGPALVAAFANSPLHAGRPTGWHSSRQAAWLALDPGRTRPPAVRRGEPLTESWTRWCLDAAVMLVRRPDGPWTAPPGLTFRDWIRHGRAAVPDRPPPTPDDLGYHLSTLFPPVRARGHLEVRYLDAQPDGWWPVPVAVVSALVDDVTVAQEALAGCAAVRGRWQDAAHRGMRDRELARAAGEVLLAAAGSLARHPDTAPVARIVHAYLEHWTLRGRSPADDLLDGVRPPVAPTVRRLQGVLS